MSDSQGPAGDRGVGILAKAGALLLFFAEHGGRCSMREIASELSMPRSTVHRLCLQLVAEGFLSHDGEGETFTWGPTMISVSRAVGRSVNSDRLIQTVLESLVDETNETALLTSFDRDKRHVVVTRQVEAPQTVLYKAEFNKPSALHAGASGKSVLAFLPFDEQDAILADALDTITEATVVDPEALRRDLERIRADGVAVSFGERTHGAVGHASPVFDESGRVVGSLCVTVPEYRHSADLEKLIRQRLTHYSRAVSDILGLPPGHPYPPMP